MHILIKFAIGLVIGLGSYAWLRLKVIPAINKISSEQGTDKGYRNDLEMIKALRKSRTLRSL